MICHIKLDKPLEAGVPNVKAIVYHIFVVHWCHMFLISIEIEYLGNRHAQNYR